MQIQHPQLLEFLKPTRKYSVETIGWKLDIIECPKLSELLRNGTIKGGYLRDQYAAKISWSLKQAQASSKAITREAEIPKHGGESNQSIEL